MLNFFKKKETKNYRKVLEELDEKIRQVTLKLSDLQYQQHRWSSLWTYYTFAIYLFYLSFFHLSLKYDPHFILWSVLILIIPLCIYYGRRLINYVYDLKRQGQESLLENLKNQHKTNLDEMAEKTGFNEIKSIYEKYESPLKENKHSTMSSPFQPGTPSTMGQRPMVMNGLQAPMNANPIGMISSPMNHHQQQMQGGPNIPPMMRPNLPPMGYDHKTPSKANTVFDKFLDSLVGYPEGPHSQYALICSNCFTHNGLAMPDEYHNMKYRCLKCGTLNMNGQQINNNLKESNLQIEKNSLNSPSNTMQQDQEKERKGDQENPFLSQENNEKASDYLPEQGNSLTNETSIIGSSRNS